MFETIQTSYELLLPIVERGETIRSFVDESHILADQNSSESSDTLFPSGQTQIQRMSLLIQTQVIICRRYEQEMSRLKYPAYPILIMCISQPPRTSRCDSTRSEFAKIDRAKFVLLAVELVFRSCLISPLNAEELVASNGVPSLATLLDFYVDLIKTIGTPDSTPKKELNFASGETIYGIVAYIIRTLTGVAFYQKGLDAIKTLDDRPTFLLNWRSCVSDDFLENRDGSDSSIRRCALEGIANIARDPILQEELIGSGVVWPIIRYTMMFDSTVEESPTDISDVDDVGFSMSSINRNARLSVRALGVLSGLYGDGSKHHGLIDLLNILLTPPIAKMLRNRRTNSILKVLNANVERPDIIWNVEMRKQLEAYVSRQETNRLESLCRSSIDELSDGKLFGYDVLRNELKIGDIYVRQFNRGGKEALVFVENAKKFLESVVNSIAQTLNHASPINHWVDINVYQSSTDVESIVLPDHDLLAAMKTLQILCLNDGLLDDALRSSPSNISSVLFCLLYLPHTSEVEYRYKLSIFLEP